MVSPVRNQTFQDGNLDPSQENFHTSLVASFIVTSTSELGDKTFFMTIILAMHHSRTLTLLGASLGQFLMTAVAVTLGIAVSLVPVTLTKWASCLCMTFFGLKMLYDGSNMPLDKEDMNLFSENNERNVDTLKEGQVLDKGEKNNEKEANGYSPASNIKSLYGGSGQNVLIKAFTLSVLGEWGDRSQISTILLASNGNPYGVAIGSFVGHVVCSLIAVLGGRLIGQRFPVRTMTQAGGVVFLLCAGSSVVFD